MIGTMMRQMRSAQLAGVKRRRKLLEHQSRFYTTSCGRTIADTLLRETAAAL